MEDFDYQGKRKDQVKSSEDIASIAILGIIVLVGTLSIIEIFKNL